MVSIVQKRIKNKFLQQLILVILSLVLFSLNLSSATNQNQLSKVLTKDTLLIKKLIVEGNILLDSAKFDSARIYFLEAINIQESFIVKSNDTTEINEWWKCHRLVSNTYSEKKLYPKAIEYLKSKLSDISFPKNKFICSELVECHAHIAENYLKLGDLNNSIDYFKGSLDMSHKLHNLSHIADLEYQMGRAYLFTGLKDSTAKYTNQSLSYRIKENDTIGMIAPYDLLGSATFQLGEYKKAIELFKKSEKLSFLVGRGKHAKTAGTLSNMGVSYWALGDLENALLNFGRAIEIKKATETNNDAATASIYTNMGIISREQGDYTKALELYKKAISIFDTVLPKGHFRFGQVNGNIGAAYIFKKDYRNALLYLEKTREIFEKNPSYSTFLGSNYLNLGAAYTKTNQQEKAFYFLNKSIKEQEILKGKNHAEVADFYTALGDYYLHFRDFNEAINTYNKALTIYEKALGKTHPDIARLYILLGRTYREKGENQLALKTFNKAIKAIIPSFEESNIYQCPSKLETTLTKYLMVEILRYKGEILLNISQSPNEDRKALNAATKHFNIASLYIDELRKDYQREETKKDLNISTKIIYEKGIEANLQLYSIDHIDEYKAKAFEFSEKSKASNLLAFLHANNKEIFSTLPNELITTRKANEISLAYYEKSLFEEKLKGVNSDSVKLKLYEDKLFGYREVQDSIIGILKKDFPKYFGLKYNTEISSIEAIQMHLDKDQTVLSYFIGASKIYAFVINNKEYSTIELKKDVPLEDWISQLQKNIYGYHLIQNKSIEAQQKIADTIVNRSYQLYTKIFLPLLKKKNLSEQIIIIPDGVLGYLPFEVLLRTIPEKSTNFASHDYLLKYYQFSYNYSTTLWMEMKERKQKKVAGNLLAIAPEFTGTKNTKTRSIKELRSKLGALKFNVSEAKTIQKIIGGKLLIENNATEEKFITEAPFYKIIHLATHGKANDKIGDNSFLAFSALSDSLENGLLYNRDLYNLQLNADMAVLSACETGIGELQKGEGIISLARGFSYAGAKSIITSLWSANDQSTFQLMESFYENIKNGKSKDEALRKAKLDYLAKADNYYAHPFYWGAFISIGDMSPIKLNSSSPYHYYIGILMIILGVIAFLFLKSRKE